MLCSICGNEYSLDTVVELTVCPYCNNSTVNEAALISMQPPQLHRRLNLKKGQPFVDQALRRMAWELPLSARQGYKALTLIHGYGASGVGGAIREAVRTQLHFLERRRQISDSIFGEHFEGRSSRGRQLLRRFPFLGLHQDINRANPGITIVIL